MNLAKVVASSLTILSADSALWRPSYRIRPPLCLKVRFVLPSLCSPPHRRSSSLPHVLPFVLLPNFKLFTETPWLVGDRNRVKDFASSPPGQNISPRLYRSQSIQDQLNKTPRVNPHWGHSLSRSHGGNDWPLPASPTSSSPTYISPLTPTVAQQAMFTAGLTNEQAFPETGGPKKRGPKPKNEPAATVKLGIEIVY